MLRHVKQVAREDHEADLQAAAKRGADNYAAEEGAEISRDAVKVRPRRSSAAGEPGDKRGGCGSVKGDDKPSR